MEFQEIFTSQFTTNTTCYSGARNPKTSLLRLATENHVLSVETKACETVPRDNTTVICVGYSERAGLEALALVDPAQLLLEDVDLDRPPAISSPFLTDNNRDDSQSVVSTTAQSVSTESRRRGAAGSAGGATASTASVTTNSTSTSGPNKPSSETAVTSTAANAQQQPQAESSSTVAASSTASTPKDSTTTTPTTTTTNNNNNNMEDDLDIINNNNKFKSCKARLILKDATTKKEYFALCDFRPLCPCVTSMGIWLGSADDSILRLFVPKDDDFRLHVHPGLNTEHFTFASPIMALDYLEVDKDDDDDDDNDDSTTDNTTTTNDDNTKNHTTRILAVACQDGTISVTSWKNDNFSDIYSSRVVVDGPLVCLQLAVISQRPEQQQQQTTNESSSKVRLVVGSLCGYVCEMEYAAGKWNGPFMIMKEGFWNSALEAEDSVLAVSTWESSPSKHVYIAVGTQSGRLLLYRKDHRQKGAKEYQKVWECLLPYSVHGVVKNGEENIENDDDQNAKRQRLVATTRRSVHVFEETMKGLEQRRKEEAKMGDFDNSEEKYSAALAKERLQSLLLAADPAEEKVIPEAETKDDKMDGDWIVLSESTDDRAASVEEETETLPKTENTLD